MRTVTELAKILKKMHAAGGRDAIRAWLGHVKLDTTNIYAEIDFETKARAIALCDQAESEGTRAWKRDAGIMAFLRTL